MTSPRETESRRSGLGLFWPQHRLGSVLVFLVSTAGATLAANFERPISSALVYVLGVTVIGAMSGLLSGLLAALGASVLYNFFLSEPVLAFSASGIDEFVPLVAFNLCAIISGLLAGRLNERARIAERAQARLNILLVVSDRLQKVVLLPDLVSAMNGDDIRPWLGRFELYDGDGEPVGLPPGGSRWSAYVRAESAAPMHMVDGPCVTSFRLGAAGRTLGTAIFGDPEDRSGNPIVDMDAIVTLLSMTVERCLLLQQLSQTEAVRRSEELKTALLSSLSHDMRTPLSAIAASATSLLSLSEDLDPGVRMKLLQTIQEQCARLDRYTANLLDLGRLQAGIDPDKLIDVDVIEVLGTVLRSTRALHNSHSISKQFECDSAIVRANPVMVEQVFMNLLDNAVRYSPEGSTIALKLTETSSHVSVEIIDQGCGVPKSDLPHLFDRFYRSSRTAHQEGHGLGLSIAKGFVDVFGGAMEINSPHAGGIGTQVLVQLPLSKRPAKMMHG